MRAEVSGIPSPRKVRERMGHPVIVGVSRVGHPPEVKGEPPGFMDGLGQVVRRSHLQGTWLIANPKTRLIFFEHLPNAPSVTWMKTSVPPIAAARTC